MTYVEYESPEHMRVKVWHGGLKSCFLYPEDEEERKCRITWEHSMQMPKRKVKKKQRKYVSQ